MCHDDDGRAFFRNNFKLEEEVDKEVKMLEENFAKALKWQRLLWCNPGPWSLKEEEVDTVLIDKFLVKIICQRQRGRSTGTFSRELSKNLKTFSEAQSASCSKYLGTILEFPYKCFQMPATSLMWLWFGQITRMEEQMKSKLAGKEGHLKWFSCWCGNVDKTTIKEGFSPAKPQSFIDY